jgi:hypothetical protein
MERRSKTRAQRAQEVTSLATEVVDGLEHMREFKIAYDRIGDKQYQKARLHLINTLVALVRATAEAAIQVVRSSEERLAAIEKRRAGNDR